MVEGCVKSKFLQFVLFSLVCPFCQWETSEIEFPSIENASANGINSYDCHLYILLMRSYSGESQCAKSWIPLYPELRSIKNIQCIITTLI